jgi:hypothetical protein
MNYVGALRQAQCDVNTSTPQYRRAQGDLLYIHY